MLFAFFRGTSQYMSPVSPGAVRALPAEERPDNLLALPLGQNERLPRPFAFDMAQEALEELASAICGILVEPEAA